MKLKSKLKLYEEFLNSINENNDGNSSTEVAIDQVTVDAGNVVRTEVIRDVDTILNNLAELSDRIGESALVGLEMDELYEELFDMLNTSELNEGILDFIKSPIKFTKIKKNLKAYQKALVQKAINDVDFAKKKQAGDADEKDKKRMETLKQANEAKNKALDDQLSAIAERMTELSGSDKGLAKVVSIGKTKSKLAAAKIVMKATSGEEAKQLKLEIDTLNNRIADDEKSLKDYAKKQGPADDTDDTDDNSGDADNQTSKDQMAGLGDGDDNKDDKKIEKLEAAVTKAQEVKDGLGEDASPKEKAEADIAVFKAKIAAAKIKEEDTADLELKLKAAETKAALPVVPSPAAGGSYDENVELDGSGRLAPIMEETEDNTITEASLNGLMASDSDGDDYAYLKQQAKKLGVKVSVDKDPFGDGYDELNYSGDKSAVLKLAKISGHDSDICSEPDCGGYELTEGNAFGAARAEAIAKGEKTFTVDDEEFDVESVDAKDKENAEEFVEESTTELPKTINLDEGLTIAQKFARLM